MRSNVVVWLGVFVGSSALVGCSFLDDFDKFHPESEGTGDGADDAGVPPDDGAVADIKDAGKDAANDPGKDGAVVGDAGGAHVDAGEPGVVDSSVPRDSAVDAGHLGVCGDGVIDTARGETCDDRNQVAGDGCEPGTCTATPVPTCAGKVCSDNDPCTVDSCDPSTTMCAYRVIDGDGDGYSPGFCRPASGHLGGDCNDANADVHPDATELCDGIDNNCDNPRQIDEGLVKLKCYPDSDRDGFANLDMAGMLACVCPTGSIAVANPEDRSKHDCWDDPVTRGVDAFPGQTDYFEEGYGPGGRNMRSFDYDCDGKSTPKLGALPDSCGGLLGLACAAKVGYSDQVPSCGDSAEFTTCGMAGLNCSGTTESRKQSCR